MPSNHLTGNHMDNNKIITIDQLKEESVNLFNNKIINYLLSISGHKFGKGYDGGVYRMTKVLIIQSYHVRLIGYLTKLSNDNVDFSKLTHEQHSDIHEQISFIAYLIDRADENFDYEYENEGTGNSKNIFLYKDINDVDAMDFSYMKYFTLEFTND